MKYVLIVLTSMLCFAFRATAQSPAYKDAAFTEYFRATSGWTAGDATISVGLPGYKSLWLFGDSYIDNLHAADTSLPCLFQVRNAMVIQDMVNPADLHTVLDDTQTGVNRTPVKVQNNDPTYFWPGHGYVKGDTAVVFWQRYSGEDYTHLGNYVVKIYLPGFADASAIKAIEELPLPDEVEFGLSVVVDSASNYLYLYGHIKDWIIHRPLVARCPMGQEIVSDWEFYDGAGWNTDVGEAEQLMADTDDYVSPSYSVIKLQGKYYMISQENGFLECGEGRNIYSWESSTPYGPFTNKKLLYTIDDAYQGEYWITYNATAHPEFIKNNELLVSYNLNGTCPNECSDPFADRRNADGYRPKFIRVPLTYIDPALNVPDPVLPVVTGSGHADDRGDQVRVFPNPVYGSEFTVHIPDHFRSGPVHLSVRNVCGQVVFEDSVTENTTVRVNAGGLFFVRLQGPNGLASTRIIVRAE